MLNEIQEFELYTEKCCYSVSSKSDKSYLGRFTYDMIEKNYGFDHILTIIARGYMFKNGNADVECARKALCAWCSIPKTKIALPLKEGQSETDFRILHKEFPKLVNNKGEGWYYRHINNIFNFVKTNANKLSKGTDVKCEKIKKEFDKKWRNKVTQYQISLYNRNTKNAWITRFDDILADALDQGELKNKDFDLPPETEQALISKTPKGVKQGVLLTLYKYYLANKSDDSDWVVLPVTNFDAYFGTTQFSKKWLNMLPEDNIQRNTNYGVSRYMFVLI